MKTFIKNKTSFLTITLILCLNGFLFQSSYSSTNAQTDNFLTSHWYLDEGEVDGESISVQDLGGSLFYRIGNTEYFKIIYGHSCIEFITVPYTNVTDNTFTLGLIEEFISCEYSDPNELAAVELYKSFYFQLPIDSNGAPNNPFTYEFVDNGNPVLDLMIINSNGDWALFTTDYLNLSDFSKDNFRLYPNPVKENLTINNTSNQSVIATIYDVSGKLLQSHTLEANASNINVKTLKAGLYFVVFESEAGERVSKKFIKK